MRVLIGTRKGLFRLEHRRDGWHLGEPRFLGVPTLNAIRDPRDGSIWACLGHGHWGPKLHVSHDDLKSFEEKTCPAFPAGFEIDSISDFGTSRGPASVRHLYTIEPAGEPGNYHMGTDPGGFFTTRDGADTWELNEPLWKHRNEDGWFEGGGGVMLHSICVASTDPNRIHIGISCAGVYETTDGGRTWTPRNHGVRAEFLPNKAPEVGQDTHILRRHPLDPDLLWQQNHCGNYRSTDGGRNWADVTGGLPTPIGFGLALDERDTQVAWTVPMTSDERRVAPEGALVVSRTLDGGRTWQAMRKGLPARHCYDIVFRHALDALNGCLVFGTTCGRVFSSLDRGESWQPLDACLPPVNSIHFER